MDPTIVTVVVLAVLALVVVAVVAAVVRRNRERRRREHLQQRFGPEYDRAVAGGDHRSAEARLAKAERERERLDVRPLTAESRRRRTAQWQAVQADFVEMPVESVDRADELVREVMTERGYPDQGDEQAMTLLAADHAETVEHYRTAQAHRSSFRSGEGSTEDLRRALVEYRRLFDVLVHEGADREDPSDDSALVDGSTRPDGTPMTADDYVRARQGTVREPAEEPVTEPATQPHAGQHRGQHLSDDDRAPIGEHAAPRQVDIRDERDQRDPAPAPSPVRDAGGRARDGR